MKKRVKSFEVSKMKSGKNGHSYKVTVHHHPKHESGRGMKGLIGHYEGPEEHSHPSKARLKKHIDELTSSMSVSPQGDGDEQEPDETGKESSALNE
jgi:hypothetical protein